MEAAQKQREQNEERQKKDARRVRKVSGHPLMTRSEKPVFKKTKEEKKNLTQEEEDLLQYLGELTVLQPVRK